MGKSKYSKKLMLPYRVVVKSYYPMKQQTSIFKSWKLIFLRTSFGAISLENYRPILKENKRYSFSNKGKNTNKLFIWRSKQDQDVVNIDNLNNDNINVFELPSEINARLSQPLILHLFGGLVVGLLFSASVIILAIFLSTSIRMRSQIENIPGMLVLSRIPLIEI